MPSDRMRSCAATMRRASSIVVGASTASAVKVCVPAQFRSVTPPRYAMTAENVQHHNKVVGVERKTKKPPQSGGFSFTVSTQCAPEGTRTPNLLIRSQMLYPLSYGRSAWESLPGRRQA
ncbi:putative GTPase [Microbacterium sp. TS-1]|nr:putative GTPase [Microbacterium sp. TS-1]